MSKATEMVLYRTCKRMIERGSTDDRYARREERAGLTHGGA